MTVDLGKTNAKAESANISDMCWVKPHLLSNNLVDKLMVSFFAAGNDASIASGEYSHYISKCQGIDSVSVFDSQIPPSQMPSR
jgi:hypothetical protein